MKKNLVKIVMSLLFVMLISTSVFANQKLDAIGKKNLRSGNMHKNGKRFDKAIGFYLLVLKENPNHIEAAEKLGDIYYTDKKDYEKAFKYLTLAVNNIDKEIAEYKKLQEEKPKKAKKYQKKIDKYSKEKAKILKYVQSSWAKLYESAANLINPKVKKSDITKDDYLKALKKFKHISQVTPDSAKTLKMIGYCYTKLDSTDKAIQYISTYLSKKEDYLTRANLANLYFNEKKYQEAAKQYEKLIKLDPKKPDNYYNICLVYNDLNQYDKALKAIDKFLELKPDDSDGYSLAFQTAVKKDSNDKTTQLKYYKKYADLNPNDASVLQNISILYYQNKNYKEALSYAQKWYDLSKSKESVELILGAAKKLDDTATFKKFSQIYKSFK